MSARLFFDIETRANAAALTHLPDPEAPANYKDATKIAAVIAEKKAQQIAQAPLDPDTGFVSAVAYMVGPEGEPQVHVLVPASSGTGGDLPAHAVPYVYTDEADRDRQERRLLEHFWDVFARLNGICCGYNVVAFDLPFLLRRSMAVRAAAPAVLPVLARHSPDPTLAASRGVRDLFGLLYHWGPGKGLKTLSRLYGLPNGLPALTGADVAGMDWRTEAAYAVNDLQLLAALYRRMAGFYWPLDAE